MKRKYLLLFLPLAALLLVALSSCSKSEKDDIQGGDDLPVNSDTYMEVCQHVSSVSKEIMEYYKKCSTISEMANYSSEIKALDYVEDVYSSNMTMFVRIKDFGVITFSKYPKDKDNRNSTRLQLSKLYNTTRAAKRASSHTQIELESAIVINQQSKDEKMEDRRLAASTAASILNDCHVTAKIENTPSVSFFRNDIFDYDLVFLITHGCYDKKTGLHWFLTGERLSDDNAVYIKAEKLYEYKGMPRDQVSFGCVDEVRNGKEVEVWYASVSEKYIASSNKDFKNRGKAIVFNGACQTMQGPSTENIDSVNYTMARAFEDRGACAYFGYDESNYCGQEAGLIFISQLLSGMSIENSFEAISDSYRHEYHSKGKWFWKSETWVDLIPYYAKSKNYCIARPIVEGIEDLSTGSELKHQIKASSPMVLRFIDYDEGTDTYSVKTFGIVFDALIQYGIEMSESSEFTNASRLLYLPVTECDYDGKNASFSVTVTSKELKPNTTYYVRSLFYDGKDTYYSDSCPFTTGSVPTGGNTTVPDVPGSNF